MPKIVEVEGLGEVEFPDSATPDQIINFLQEKVGLNDEQLVQAAETPGNNYFEKIGRDKALLEYERYRKIKKDDTTSWGEVYDMAGQAAGVLRDDVLKAYKELRTEDYDLSKFARSLFEGAILRGTNDLVRLGAPLAMGSSWFGTEDTYEQYLENNNLEQSVEARNNYLGQLKGDFADFMFLREWDGERERVRKGETTYIERLGLDKHIGKDVLKDFTEMASYADPTMAAGGVTTLFKTGGKTVAKVAATAAKLPKGIGMGVRVAGEIPERAVGKVVGVTAGKEAGEEATKSVAAGTMGATLAGGPTAPLTGLKVGGGTVEKVGEALETAAETLDRPPLPGGGVFEDVARRKQKGPLAILGAIGQAAKGSTALRVAGGLGKGTIAGGAVGAGLASIESLREKNFLETAVPGLTLGAVMGGIGGGGTQAFREATGFEFRTQVKRNTQDWLTGKSDTEIQNLKDKGLTRKDFDKIAFVERVVAGVGGNDLMFQYLKGPEFKALAGTDAQGIFMHQGVDGRPTVAINLDRAKNTNRTIYHEIGHALDELDFAPEGKKRLNDALFGRSLEDGTILKEGVIRDDMLEDLGAQYGINNLPNLSPDPAVRNIQIKDAIAKEIRAEAWANMLDGKSIRKLGKNGIISRMLDGAVLRDADSKLSNFLQRIIPNKETGSADGLFTIGETPFYNSPEVNNLLESLFRSKRRLYKRLELDVESKRNVITPKDFNEKTGKHLAETFRDSDLFLRDENGEILNQQLQPISRFGGIPKFLDTKARKAFRLRRAKLIQEALESAAPDPATDKLGRTSFRFFVDPVVRQHFRANGLGAYLNDAQMNALRALPRDVLSPSLLEKIEIFNKAAKEGGGKQFAIMYNAALKDTGKYASLSNEYRQGIVLDFEVSTKGNFGVRTLDMTALYNRIYALMDKFPKDAKGKSHEFWEPWGGMEKAMDGADPKFVEGFFKYLDNHKAHAMGDKTRQGWMGLHTDEFKAKQMRNVYNEIIGWRGRKEDSNPLIGTIFAEKENPIKSRRLDRINEVYERTEQPEVFINPSLQRDNLMPLEGAKQLLDHSRTGLKAGDYFIGVAPLRRQNIKDVNADKEFDNAKYQHLKTNAKNIADVLGLKIKEEHDVFGGWEEDGKQSRETSYRIKVSTNDKSKVEAYAALVGALAPEVQNSVMVVEPLPNTAIDKADSFEVSMPVRSKAKGQDLSEKITSYGFEGYTYDPDKKEFLLVFNKDNQSKFNELVEYALGNKLIYENKIKAIPAKANFLGEGDYKGTYSKVRDKIGEFTERTDDLNTLLTEAERQIDESLANEPIKAKAADVLAQLTEPKESAVRILKDPDLVSEPTDASKVIGTGKFFDKRALDMEYGDVAYTEANKARMTEALTYEAIYQLSKDGNAFGWYDRAVKKALSIIHDLHPEIKTNPESDLIFKSFLAITSNGQAVTDNFKSANVAYTHYKKHGTVPDDMTFGGKQGVAIYKGLKEFEAMIKKDGYEKTREFLSKKFTVGDLKRKFGVKISSENVAAVVPGAAIFGPKIGSFFNNLYGDYSTLTMDLWFSRTMNRMMGSMVRIATPEEKAKRYVRLRKGIEGYWKEAKLGKEDTHQGYTKAELLDDDVKLHDYTLKHQAEFRKKKYKSPKGKPALTELNKASNNYFNTFESMEDTPRTGTERQYFRSVIQGVQDRIQQLGLPKIEIADIQALLWYSEKDLFDAFNAVNKKSEGVDYSDAARALAADMGVNPMKLLMPSDPPIKTDGYGSTSFTDSPPSKKKKKAPAKDDFGSRATNRPSVPTDALYGLSAAKGSLNSYKRRNPFIDNSKKVRKNLDNLKDNKVKDIDNDIRMVRSEMQPYIKKGSLTRDEGLKFNKLVSKHESLLFDRRRLKGIDKGDVSKVKPSSETKSTLSSEVVSQAFTDKHKSKAVFTEMQKLAAGTFFNADTPIDLAFKGENPNLTGKQLYNAFSTTRKKLREQYGNTVPLYRLETGRQKSKPTALWATTEAFVNSFLKDPNYKGAKLRQESIPVDQVAAVNVKRDGTYHEFVIVDEMWKPK